MFLRLVVTASLLLAASVGAQIVMETDDPVLPKIVVIRGEGEIVDPDKWTEFPTKAPIPTDTPTTYPTELSPAPTALAYKLWPKGSHAQCILDTQLKKDDCLEAAYRLGSKEYKFPYYLNIVKDSGLPCGCFLFFNQGQVTVEYNQNTLSSGGCSANAYSALVCDIPPPTPAPSYNPTPYPTPIPTPNPTSPTSLMMLSGPQGYVNSFDGAFDYSASHNGRRGAIYHVYSYHSNGAEDRRFEFGTAATTVGDLVYESRYGNINSYDSTSYVDCPANYVLTGIQSHHHNGAEDRQFRYDCGHFSGWSTSNPNTTPYVNGWDQTVNYYCPSGKVLTGMRSYHNNGPEDRRFQFTCSTWTFGA